MSDEKAVVSWEERLSQEAKAVASQERAPTSTISLKSGVMSYMGEVIKGNNLDCVIVASAAENVLYLTDYDPDVVVPPDCFALGTLEQSGRDGEGLIPHSVVPEPQNDTCLGCPQFEWGSGRGRGKACSHRRRIALIPADALKSEADIAKAEIARMGISVTNVKHWSKYVNQVAAEYQRPFWAVLTNVSVQPDPKSQFRLVFETKGVVNKDYLEALYKVNQLAMSQLLEPYDMSPPQEKEEAPAKGRKKKY